jgi:phytoene dehydrogenase-like protein
MTSRSVVVVGGGVAGLSCAVRLWRKGVRCQVVEASDAVGGRIRTDLVDGFRLDRGFQVFLTSYPEANALLDYEALQLQPFLPGALVRFGGRFHMVADPWRRPISALRAIGSPVGSLRDKLRVASFRAATLRGTLEDQLSEPEVTSRDALSQWGFSPEMLDRFFRPFLGGIFLDSDLRTSSRMLRFVFRMFSLGATTLPAEGMEAIPRQLASHAPKGAIHTGTRVAAVAPGVVTLESGECLDAEHVVVAVEGPAARALLNTPAGDGLGLSLDHGQSVTCLYFAAERPPVAEPVLLLNGEGPGPINNVCVPTSVASSYGPAGQALVSVTVLGASPNVLLLESEVRSQLEEWFGAEATNWQLLRSYVIPYALPSKVPPALTATQHQVKRDDRLWICGDHCDTASINGAMASGRRVAEGILSAH